MFRLRKKVYLDNNATTVVDKDVVKVINSVLKKHYGNPSSLYKIAYSSTEILENSRDEISQSINAKPEEIIFSGCATEANNQIIHSVFEHFFPTKTKVITTPIEHPSVLSTLDFLKTKGLEVEYFKVDKYGRIDLKDFEDRIDSSYFLICSMFVNNELGTIQDLKTISSIARNHGVLFFSDCVQAYGKVKVDVDDLDIDYASFSAHKINGPKGIGVLYARTGSPISPFVHGGHQEKGLRAGTESLHNIAGFAEASKKVESKISDDSKIHEIMNYFRKGIREIYPESIFNTPETNSVSNTLNVTFPNISNSFLMSSLDFRGISVSAGSACNTPSNDPSHVLMAIGLTDQQARETIRFSLSNKTTFQDIKYTLKAIRDYLQEKENSINMLTPFEFDESMIYNPEIFILDIRSDYERKSIKSFPNAYKAEFWKIERHVKFLPKNKNMVVVCQGGVNSPIIAYYLKKKGFNNLSFIMTGMFGWKLAHPELNNKFAGNYIT